MFWQGQLLEIAETGSPWCTMDQAEAFIEAEDFAAF